jgi:hypothetical protein
MYKYMIIKNVFIHNKDDKYNKFIFIVFIIFIYTDLYCSYCSFNYAALRRGGMYFG